MSLESGPSTPPPAKRKPPSMAKNLLFAAAVHAGAGLAAHEGPKVYEAGKHAVAQARQGIEHFVEEQEVKLDRHRMLSEARQAQAEHRPWAGRFLVHSWFLEKRAQHQQFRDERLVQDQYDQLLTQLRVRLHGEPLSAELVQRSLGQLLEGYDYWGGAGEASPVDFLREHGGNCESVGPLVAALLQDLSIPNVGLRIIAPNPQDEQPTGHIEATLRIPTNGARLREYGLQAGREMSGNGVYVRAADLLNYYQPGSTHLHFPTPQTEAERRPNPAGNPTIIPFQEHAVASTIQEGVDRSTEDNERELSRLFAGRTSLLAEAERIIDSTDHPAIIGEQVIDIPSDTFVPVEAHERFTTGEWRNASRIARDLIQTAHAIKQTRSNGEARQLAAVYGALARLHDRLFQEAALQLRHSAAQRFEAQRDSFLQQYETQRTRYASSNAPYNLENYAERIEFHAILASSEQARRDQFNRLHTELQTTPSTERRSQIFAGYRTLLEFGLHPELRQAITRSLEEAGRDPFNQGLILREFLSESEAPPEGNHPLVRAIARFEDIETGAAVTEATIRAATSQTQFEQAMEAGFRARFPDATYERGYTFGATIGIIRSAEVPAEPRGEEAEEHYLDTLREALDRAQNAQKLCDWYVNDPTVPQAFISTERTRIASVIPQIEQAIRDELRWEAQDETAVQRGPAIHIPPGESRTVRAP